MIKSSTDGYGCYYTFDYMTGIKLGKIQQKVKKYYKKLLILHTQTHIQILSLLREQIQLSYIDLI